MKLFKRKIFIGLLIILIISFPVRSAHAINPFEIFNTLTQLFTVAFYTALPIIAPLALITILPLIPMDFVTGNWVLCQVMGVDGPIFQNCSSGGTPVILNAQSLECAFSYQPTFYIPQFSSGETNNQVAIYRFYISASSDQATLNSWYFNTIKDNVGNGFTDLGQFFEFPRTTPPWTWDCRESTYNVASNDATPLRIFSYAEECSGNVCNKYIDGTIPENSYVVYVAKMLGDYTGWKITGYDYDLSLYQCVQATNNLNKFLNNNNNGVFANFPNPSIDLGNAIVGPLKTGPCPKYRCSGASCVQDDLNGTYATSNCDNACALPPCVPTNPGCDVNTCAGQTCDNGCNLVNGTKTTGSCCVPTSPGCDADTCVGQTCNTGCGLINGTKTSGVCAPAPIADIKANGSNGPITISYNTSPIISWSVSGDADSCSVSPAGWTGTSGSQSAGNLTSSQTYTVTCVGPGGLDSKSVTVNVQAATLLIDSFSANPSTGHVPVNGVDLKATVSGSAIGTISYTFYCNRSDSGTNITIGWAAKYDGQSAPTKTAVNVCDYSAVGDYSAKVIVERDSLAVEARTLITVTNNPPNAAPINPPTQPYYCVSGPAATFSWTFSDSDSGDTQSAYQIQVDNNSDFSSPEVDSGNVISASNSYAAVTGDLSYNASYYWRVKVWDNHNMPSSWTNGSAFSTPAHSYPNADFSNWLPTNPSAGEQVIFNAPSQPAGVNANFSWIFAGGNPGSANGSPAVTAFSSSGMFTVTLTVTDSDHPYSCSVQKNISVRFALPDWKEIAP